MCSPHGGSVVTKNVSITYRGSTDENSWETHIHTAVARTLRGDPRRLHQSAANRLPPLRRHHNALHDTVARDSSIVEARVCDLPQAQRWSDRATAPSFAGCTEECPLIAWSVMRNQEGWLKSSRRRLNRWADGPGRDC